jgi:hypothetical protein
VRSPQKFFAALYNILMATVPSEIHGQRYISLATFRKSGVAVYTPIWFAEDDNKLYFMTNSKLGKCKRILRPEEFARARQTINRKYWLARVPLLWRNTDTYFEITLA